MSEAEKCENLFNLVERGMSESKTEVQEGAETVHVMKTTRKLRLHTKTIIGVH